MPASPPIPPAEEEEDYMSMTIAEPTGPIQKETYTQRRIRKQREAEARSHPKSKAELLAAEAEARDTALSTSMLADPTKAATNKGLAMMAKMGFQPGKSLGKDLKGFEARTEPVRFIMKEDRGGIGLDSEKKRKFQEGVEGEVKRVKAEEGEYRERVRREREEVRLEGMVGGAMRVAERMDGEREEEVADEVWKKDHENAESKSEREHDKRGVVISRKPLKHINVLWRELVRRREEKERDRRMRYDLHQSLSRLPTYDDADEDKNDKRALGKDAVQYALVEDLEEEDLELDAFNALDPSERLQRLVLYLREEYNYCFWCKFKYPDEDMDGCPGITEDDHD